MNMQTTIRSEGALAPWRWHDAAVGLLLGALMSLGLWHGREALLALWSVVMQFWDQALELGLASLPARVQAPSALLNGATALLAALLFGVAGLWPEHWRPWRVVVRGLCLVQASACLFFAWLPAHFPHAVQRHLDGLLQMGADLLLLMPWMLTFGWGLLNLPLRLRLLGPLAVLGYFIAWVPHQVLLHAWVLAHGTVLFMPLLLLCLGPLLNGWLFVALYGWLVSLTPRVAGTGTGDA